MPIKGDLSSVQLADVFQMLSMSQREGTLVVKDAHTERRIYFSPQGVALLTSGERRAVKLGEVLLKAGKVTRDQLDQGLAEQQETGKRVGEILIAKNIVTQADIDAVVRGQIEEQIYDLFLWRDATFEFLEGPADDNRDTIVRSATQLTFDVNGLLLEALRRVDEWGLINKHISTLDSVFAFAGDGARAEAEKDAGEAEKRILEVLDGTHSLKDISHSTGFSSFDVCRVVKELALAGKVAAATPETLAEKAAAFEGQDRPVDALRLYRTVVALKGAAAESALLRKVAELSERTGASAEALEHYRKAAHAANEAGEAPVLAECLARVCALDPGNVDSALAHFDILLALGRTDEAKQAGQRAAAAAIEKGRPNDARDVLTKVVAADPRQVPARVLLVRALKALNADRELREELRVLSKGLTAGEPEDDKVLAELRQVEPDFFREEYIPPSVQVAAKKQTRSRAMLFVSVIGVSVVLAGGLFLLTRGKLTPMNPDGGGGGGNGGGGPVGPHTGKVAIDALLVKFDDAIKGLNLERAQEVLDDMKKRVEVAGDEEASRLVEVRSRRLSEEKGAKALLDEAKERLKVKDYAGAAARVKEAKEKFPSTLSAPEARVTVLVTSRPAGARVLLENRELPARTPAEAELDLVVPQLVLKLDGFEDEPIRLTPEKIYQGVINVDFNKRKSLWDKTVNVPLRGEMRLAGKYLLAAADTMLFAFDVEGKGSSPRGWPLQLPKTIKGGPVVVGASMLVLTENGEIHGFSVADFNKPAPLAWKSKNLEGDPRGGPSLDPQGRVLVTLATKVVAVDPATGDVAWSVDLDRARPAAAAAGADESLVVVASANELTAYRWDKSIAWGPVPLGASVPPGVGPLVTSSGVVACTSDAKVHVLNPETGAARTAPLTVGPCQSTPVAEGQTAYVTSVDRRVYAISLAQPGSPVAAETGGAVCASAAVRDGIVYVGSDDNYVHALEGKTMKPLWKFKTGIPVRLSPVVGESVVLAAAGDRIYAVRWK